ncbi:hypothetical protein LOK49_LG07G00110 [Camellia lanceoleosa]|uniref:Uncharacterized protein n=1 Tax=Camellia lanceoleosa TaxID=1840588 RepID=A0ACC0H1I0_9ERIC|nr:hypothetical protein LOK49_LG07G00110 [Camellia lanceoleosa]
MFKSCKHLEIVDIMHCCGIEAEAVELFLLNCRQLRQVQVEENKLSDVARSWASNKFIEVVVCLIAIQSIQVHIPVLFHGSIVNVSDLCCEIE